ncbi:hypothetical protein MtrunA17_Chr2g0294571 [Medicago truncatula]|uniref:Transmembrane protein n=1 Tax=Medicago truncatula TaxID=3880 RepID=A0A396J7Z9_MEDTR|nr:hypothetical protein MtrunA17_Chr2g0294571 [Medicago truncatula]
MIRLCSRRPYTSTNSFSYNCTYIITWMFVRTLHFNNKTFSSTTVYFCCRRKTSKVGNIIVCHSHHVSIGMVFLFLHL